MEKLYIGIYGSVNSGKSTLINKIAGQQAALVSEQPGTTTDPVKKPIELEGLGPAVLIDTAGLDDITPLGRARVQKTLETLPLIDMAIMVAESGTLTEQDLELMGEFKKKNIPFLIINNKSDAQGYADLVFKDAPIIPYSALRAKNAKVILEALARLKPAHINQKHVLLDDLVLPGDIVVLITPIDAAAPQGRLILPQVSAIRNILDNNAIAVVLQPSQLADYIKTGVKIKLVVTDSQVFKEVNEILPKEIPLTSFSILFARLKGDLRVYLEGAAAISALKEGDKVLILESCSHSATTCEDIGRVKLPKLISAKSGKKINFKIIPALDPLPADIESYALVVQCGGCMVTRHQLMNRIDLALAAGVPVTNYGIAIAYCNGILERVTEIFKF